jgi:hypothetical protein
MSLDYTNHVMDFKTPQGLSHYNNTSTAPGATLEKRQSNVNKEYMYHKRAKDLDIDLHGTPPVQQGPIETELDEYGHKGHVIPSIIGLCTGPIQRNFD